MQQLNSQTIYLVIIPSDRICGYFGYVRTCDGKKVYGIALNMQVDLHREEGHIYIYICDSNRKKYGIKDHFASSYM